MVTYSFLSTDPVSPARLFAAVRKNFVCGGVTVIAVCLAVTAVLSGCADERDVPPKAIPSRASVAGADSSVCPETTVTLTAEAAGADSFLWKRDDAVIEAQTASVLVVSESGVYSAAGVNEAGTGTFSRPKRVAVSACIPPPVAGFSCADNLDFFVLKSTSSGEISGYLWQVSGRGDVALLTPAAAETVLELPAAEATVTVSLTVRNSGGASTSSQSIVLPPLTSSRQYGLGRVTGREISHNVDYVWYIDQGNTGPYSRVNCGPACTVMALKWIDRSFSKTTEDARNTYHPMGGWWYTNNITDYLADNQATHFIESLTQAKRLTDVLDGGDIAILCLDMYYVRGHSGRPEWHTDRFYAANSRDWGHFIVIKGYKEVDGKVWFEVYDPWSLDVKYGDGSLKGIDRYYRSEDIMKAVDVWWRYMIVIRNPRIPSVRSSRGADPSSIVHQRGR